MRKAIILAIFMLALLGFTWIFIEPLAYCLLTGILIGAIVWGVKKLLDDK